MEQRWRGGQESRNYLALMLDLFDPWLGLRPNEHQPDSKVESDPEGEDAAGLTAGQPSFSKDNSQLRQSWAICTLFTKSEKGFPTKWGSD